MISRNQLFSRNQTIKTIFRGACIIFLKMNQYMFIQECENFHEKILRFGVDFEPNVEFMS